MREVQPGAGLCLAGSCRPENYSDVQALQLDAEGRSLSVLLGSRVDVWDLIAGALVQQLDLGDTYRPWPCGRVRRTCQGHVP